MRKRHALCAGVLGSLLLGFTLGTFAHPREGEGLPSSRSRSASDTRVTETRLALECGAELITLFAHSPEYPAPVPILSVLRDTLGDADRENDLLRYVWIYTYAPPTLLQRIAAVVPFLYHQVATRRQADAPPPIAVDLSDPKRSVWGKTSRLIVQNAVLDSKGWLFRALPRTKQRNLEEYREAQIVKALAVLSLYEKTDTAALSESELTRIAAFLSPPTLLGAFLHELRLAELTMRRSQKSRERRATNWDFLRQRAEEEGLFFEPLGLPGEPPSHALLWVSREALRENFGRRAFNARFLNIKNPWTDERLRQWSGYTKTIYLDRENRRVTPDHPEARAVELIPLALYGLDFPKIPILLVDFRSALHVKARDASGKVLADSARYLLGFSPYGDLSYLLARSLLNYVTRKKGIDLNQPSRLKAYAELSALLLTDDQLDPQLKAALARRAEKARASVVENSFQYQPVIATRQHEALVRAATETPWLARRIEQDRQREYRRVSHGRAARVLFALARALTLGIYTHREEPTPELRARVDLARRMAFHRAQLEAAVRRSLRLDEEQDLEALRASLEFIRTHADLAGSEIVGMLAEAYTRSSDPEFRWMCLRTLAAIRSEAAQRALVALERDARGDPMLREKLHRERVRNGRGMPAPVANGSLPLVRDP